MHAHTYTHACTDRYNTHTHTSITKKPDVKVSFLKAVMESFLKAVMESSLHRRAVLDIHVCMDLHQLLHDLYRVITHWVFKIILSMCLSATVPWNTGWRVIFSLRCTADMYHLLWCCVIFFRTSDSIICFSGVRACAGSQTVDSSVLKPFFCLAP